MCRGVGGSVCLGISQRNGVRLLEIELGPGLMARQALVHEAVSNGAKGELGRARHAAQI